MTRLLRALAGLGLMEEQEPDTFSVTAAGALLGSSRPDSLVSFVRMFTDPAIVRAWDGLDSSVRTGGIAFDAVFGTDFFSYLGRHPELSADFNAAMSQASEETAAVLPHAYDFGRFASVTDVGGGDGSILAAILAAHPALTGVLHDTKDGLAQAPKTLDRHGVADRCSLAAGDFFRSVPGGSDLYLIKSVLHDWSDDQAVTILSHCREVLPPGGHVLIVEPVLPEVVGTAAAAHAADGGITYLSDLNMLVNLGGSGTYPQGLRRGVPPRGTVRRVGDPAAGGGPLLPDRGNGLLITSTPRGKPTDPQDTARGAHWTGAAAPQTAVAVCSRRRATVPCLRGPFAGTAAHRGDADARAPLRPVAAPQSFRTKAAPAGAPDGHALDRVSRRTDHQDPHGAQRGHPRHRPSRSAGRRGGSRPRPSACWVLTVRFLRPVEVTSRGRRGIRGCEVWALGGAAVA